jgi:lipopolysaccharide/colanic/teichoic acid biosynthesis glycosyltransferase
MHNKTFYAGYSKPVMDILGAAFFLLFFSWLIISISLVYIVFSQYPVFFVQKRIGRGGAPFKIIKFRTLKNSTASLQERRFWFGDVLRHTSLDELPQLINVIKGEMSFVGPRPLPIEYGELFSAEQHQRHQAKPGITGWAQVNGRNAISWDKKFSLDLYYVRNISFCFDIKIIIKTILLILSFRKDTSLEEQKFTGNKNA